jgi:hypothetical protein
MLNRAVTSAANHNPQPSPAHGVCCRQQHPAHLSALWEDQCAARGVLIIVFVYRQIFPHEHACGKPVACRNQPCHICWGFSLAKSLRRLQLSAMRGCALPSISFASLASPFISEPLDRASKSNPHRLAFTIHPSLLTWLLLRVWLQVLVRLHFGARLGGTREASEQLDPGQPSG